MLGEVLQINSNRWIDWIRYDFQSTFESREYKLPINFLLCDAIHNKILGDIGILIVKSLLDNSYPIDSFDQLNILNL
jgi:hypothetical protein